VRQDDFGHRRTADIAGADHGDPQGWSCHAAPL
jgi:hypothetical protein